MLCFFPSFNFILQSFFSDALQSLKSKEAICTEEYHCILRFIFIYLVLILYHFDCFQILFFTVEKFIVSFAHTHTYAKKITRKNDVQLKKIMHNIPKDVKWKKGRSNDLFNYYVINWTIFVVYFIKNQYTYSYQPENVREVLCWNATPFQHIKLNAFACTLKQIQFIYRFCWRFIWWA